MLRPRRAGHAPRPLWANGNPLTARLRRLVDDVHDGDLFEASAHAGVPYAALREIHLGRVRNAGAVLERLAAAYGLPVAWFVDEGGPDDGTIPVAGWAGYLPLGRRGGPARLTIPHSAWPLIRVLVQLEQRLRDQPAGPERPIIGAATDPREIRRRLTAFILQPLVAAGAIGADWEGAPGDDRWAAMLHDLGRFWERALGGLIPGPTGAGPLGEVA